MSCQYCEPDLNIKTLKYGALGSVGPYDYGTVLASFAVFFFFFIINIS